MLKKFAKITTHMFQVSMVYRLNFLISQLAQVVPLIGVVIFWTAVYNNSGDGIIKGYTYNEMVIYYILVQLIGKIISSDVDWNLWYSIRNGNLSYYLLRPISYPLYWFSKSLGGIVMFAACTVIVFMVFIKIIASSLALSFLSIAMFAISIAVAFIHGRAICFFRTVRAFWWQDSGGLDWIEDLLLQFLTGTLVPLAFLPGMLQDISNILPFQYLISFPILAFTNKLTVEQFINGMTIQLGWLIAFLIGSYILWRRGLRLYTAAKG